jgi:hypothetical protein
MGSSGFTSTAGSSGLALAMMSLIGEVAVEVRVVHPKEI